MLEVQPPRLAQVDGQVLFHELMLEQIQRQLAELEAANWRAPEEVWCGERFSKALHSLFHPDTTRGGRITRLLGMAVREIPFMPTDEGWLMVRFDGQLLPARKVKLT